MAGVVVQVVVVTRVKGSPRARRPAKQRLGAQTRIQRVVIENHARKRGFRELVGRATRQDVDAERRTIRVVARLVLVVDAK